MILTNEYLKLKTENLKMVEKTTSETAEVVLLN